MMDFTVIGIITFLSVARIDRGKSRCLKFCRIPFKAIESNYLLDLILMFSHLNKTLTWPFIKSPGNKKQLL